MQMSAQFIFIKRSNSGSFGVNCIRRMVELKRLLDRATVAEFAAEVPRRYRINLSKKKILQLNPIRKDDAYQALKPPNRVV